MSNTIQAIAEVETDSLFVELVVDCAVYYEPADPDVGYMSASYSADGYEMVSVNVFDQDGNAIIDSDDLAAINIALATLELAGHDCDDIISAACEEAVSNFDPRDYY